PAIDASTRNIRIRALVQNEERLLRPGMFVDVTIVLSKIRNVVTVPATAIVYAPYGNSTFVLEDSTDESPMGPTKVAKQVFVRIGERRGDIVEVVNGLEAGQMVVTTGGFKLRNGAPVVVNNSLAPKAELNPKPKDS
ncbi:MAG: efflux transporter periplasmic adaptor subunit, partial [Deltaproteobacteria bacterium]|nr:efflux transporter periplasmic adaptor subunit [Deltaproteobacteria bacterium]